jgi:hypothetical protein
MTLRELQATLQEAALDTELLDMPVFMMGEDAQDIEIETLGLTGGGLILMGGLSEEGRRLVAQQMAQMIDLETDLTK